MSSRARELLEPLLHAGNRIHTTTQIIKNEPFSNVHGATVSFHGFCSATIANHFPMV
ncbi:MAG: hypothetical protein LBF66_00660 [Holosporales bacterium]|nr:hypothetical protein [Holosporales bacterium]